MEYDEGTIEVEKSRSTWACELKSPVSCSMVSVVVVTLHVSVWVEMHQKDPCFETNYVTLHVSVWVEIFFFWFSKSKVMSRSTWACELKCFVQLNQEPVDWVTLHVSVWVEILSRKTEVDHQWSRSTWACELKFNVRWNYVIISMSRSTWACELKYGCLCHAQSFCGHAPRERVSWNSAVEVCNSAAAGHAPRERVSWNRPWWHLWRPIRVTLHVSVWVEIHH